ncbi:MAG TPA: NAD(P)/FAD-dependent oxidoreductase, partial [Acidimicrobiales bacterium]|nr:NAD(P)/FAD-dependent oxidoreductase [Acidimicrobiales bacterium]
MGSDVDVVVVGAGFAGLYMLKKLRDQGASVRVFEAGSGVGGTWYWNRYPGARCDIESVEYSYGFDEELQQEWEWSERFATQPEILRYLEHVADRFDLRSGITFDTRVESATWDEATSTWSVTTSTGETVVARHVVMATGCLSSANLPTFDGLDAFEGAVYHTGQWPHEGVDFTGKRVAVIGTGSSGIQSIPVIAQQAEQLVVLQRTAAYSVPARNRAYDPSEVERVRSIYPDLRARQRLSAAGFGGIEDAEVEMVMASELPDSDRTARLEQRWEEGGLTFLGAFADAIISPESNEVVAEFVRDKIRGIVHDPSVAEMLAPRQVIGCKRLCVDTGYYETFNRENVRLVDISSTGIERITPTGVVANGEEHEVDVIVCATGFDAMTGAL